MTCTATGLPYPSVELTMQNESGYQRLLSESPEGWRAYGACIDAAPLYQTGTYNWISLVLRSNEAFRTTYTPDGLVKDHDGNIVV